LTRNLFLDFGETVLGIPEDWLKVTRAFTDFQTQEGAEELLKATVLAYASSTWLRHSSVIKSFISFCLARELSIFESTPYIVNLFILKRVQDGVSYGMIQSFLDSLSFVLRFFKVANFVDDPMVKVIKKFAEKTCTHLKNAKQPFGSAEVRTMWDALDAKYGSIQHVPKKELRTFMLAVFQHQTFCRFSDVTKITLADLFHDVDFFKIHIRYSKTDQGGEGQFVYLPKSSSPFRNAHMLMCLYLQKMGFDSEGSPEELYLFPPLT
jgi:hypothetical protein